MIWRLARSLEQLRREVNAAFPARSKMSDGTIGDPAHSSRTSDHNPNAYGVVCAIDITHDPRNGCDAGWIANVAITDRRVKYVIWNGRLWSRARAGEGWRSYSGANPHTKHIHISVGPSAVLYDSTARWLPVPPKPNQEDDEMVLRKGASGPAVALFQRALEVEARLTGRAGGNPLPKWGADGSLGDESITAIKAYQKAAGLPETGEIDGITAALLARYQGVKA
jgi:hypothetical protein